MRGPTPQQSTQPLHQALVDWIRVDVAEDIAQVLIWSNDMRFLTNLLTALPRRLAHQQEVSAPLSENGFA